MPIARMGTYLLGFFFFFVVHADHLPSRSCDLFNLHSFAFARPFPRHGEATAMLSLLSMARVAALAHGAHPYNDLALACHMSSMIQEEYLRR